MDNIERLLADTEERLRLTLKSSGIGVWNWIVAPNVMQADEKCAALFGLSLQQFPRTIEGALALLHPGDRARINNEMTAAAERGEEYDTEYRVLWPEGAMRTLAARGKAYTDGIGGLQRVTGVCWDITERRRVEADLRTTTSKLASEVKFRRLLEAAPDAMVVVNGDDGKIILVSGQVEKLFGYLREELQGQTIELLIPSRFKNDHPWLPPRLFAAQGEAPIAAVELRGLRKDGTEFAIEVNLNPIETDEGLLVSSAIRDVSERKRQEQRIQSVTDLSDRIRTDRQTARDQLQIESNERQTARDERQVERDERQTERDERQSENVIRLEDIAAVSEAANLAKSTFLSAMSHEIRTPLNAILGYSQLMLRDSNLGPDAKANLKIINRSGEHLLSLINDVLDMSKIEAGRGEINPITFNLPRLLEDLENMFRLRADAKELRFELLVDGESVPYVVADEGKIRQVLINLLGNAIKFTEHGEVNLRVTITRKDGLWLTASVEDTGPGVSAEERKRLFQPFVQAKGGLNTQQGTGLGLAISRQHARLMGGEITAGERPGGGSIFLFRIPIEQGKNGVAIKRTSKGRVIRLQPGQETQKILVVDDHFENQNWLVRLLSAVGFSVRGASNGEEGVRVWKEWSPQLILMDVHMPVMDGLEATRRIKAHSGGEKTSIIILTASALDEERRIASNSGADDFLPKPCHEDELFESIRSLMGSVFDYELTVLDEPAARAPAWSMEGLGQVPRELLEKLRDATESGNKKILNQLILQVRDQAQEGGPALALQALADKYEYDALARLLAEACRP